MNKLIAVALLLISSGTYAQKNSLSLSLGPSVGIPLNFSSGYNPGIGGGFRIYHGVSQTNSVFGKLAVLPFPSDMDWIKNTSLTSATIGYKTPFNGPAMSFIADGGVVFKPEDAGGGSKISPVLGLGLGYAFPINNSFIDIIPNFNLAIQKGRNRTWLDIHLAYRFNVRK